MLCAGISGSENRGDSYSQGRQSCDCRVQPCNLKAWMIVPMGNRNKNELSNPKKKEIGDVSISLL